MNDVIYVILNSSLNMSAGKASAQAVHAAMMLSNTHRSNFRANYRRSVIVLAAKNREQMDGICDYLSEAEIDYEYYVDEGKNEVDAFSFTALAVAPIDSEDEKTRAIFEDLPLYGSENETIACDDYDDCDNGCSPEPDNTYTINRIHSEVLELRRLLAPKPLKVRWYQRLFRRKQSWVS